MRVVLFTHTVLVPMVIWVTLHLCRAMAPSGEHLVEYCEGETFKAACNEDEAIVVTSAHYGRMRSGKCISEQAGTMGCSVNVQTHLDRWCSGRAQCEVHVTDLLHDGTKPCPRDFRSYLEAAYICVPVLMARGDGCYGSRPVHVSTVAGYVSSLVTHETGCGSIDSPWRLIVPAGQRINVTLYDFSLYASGRDVSLGEPEAANICVVYAIIKEPSSTTISETICGGKARRSHVYLSVSNSIEVRMVSKRKGSSEDNNNEAHFLLQYQAIGCTEPEAPPGGWTRREGDTATIGCHGDDHMWELKCVQNKWTGDGATCSSGVLGSSPNVGKSLFNTSNIPKGMSIVIIVGVAVIVGLVILLVGLLCLRSRVRRHRERESLSKVVTGGEPGSQGATYRDASKPPSHTHQGALYPGQGENDYYRTWQIQQHRAVTTGAGLPHPPPPPYRPLTDPLTPPPNDHSNQHRYAEHVYESPKFERRHISPSEDGNISAKYFELDPDGLRTTSAPIDQSVHPHLVALSNESSLLHGRLET